MQTSLHIKGNDILVKKLSKGATNAISKAVFLVGNFFETKAKENINKSVYQSSASTWYKRTGKAQQSIVMQQLSSEKAKVFMGVKYGKYLEEGTGIYAGHRPFFTTFGGQLKRAVKYKGMRARPFWKPAISETRKEVKNLAQKAFIENYGN